MDTIVDIIKWAMPLIIVFVALFFVFVFGAETIKKKWIGTVQEITKTFSPGLRQFDEDTFEITLYIELDDGKDFTYSFLEKDVKGRLAKVKVGDRLIKKPSREYPEFTKQKKQEEEI